MLLRITKQCMHLMIVDEAGYADHAHSGRKRPSSRPFLWDLRILQRLADAPGCCPPGRRKEKQCELRATAASSAPRSTSSALVALPAIVAGTSTTDDGGREQLRSTGVIRFCTHQIEEGPRDRQPTTGPCPGDGHVYAANHDALAAGFRRTCSNHGDTLMHSRLHSSTLGGGTSSNASSGHGSARRGLGHHHHHRSSGSAGLRPSRCASAWARRCRLSIRPRSSPWRSVR